MRTLDRIKVLPKTINFFDMVINFLIGVRFNQNELIFKQYSSRIAGNISPVHYVLWTLRNHSAVVPSGQGQLNSARHSILNHKQNILELIYSSSIYFHRNKETIIGKFPLLWQHIKILTHKYFKLVPLFDK